ncbi:MAG: alpha/beta hydrolase [Acidobacteriota bacterium]
MTTYHNSVIEGLNVFYREAGPKEGKPLVLLHGFPSSSHMFRDLIPRLADTFHLIAPDYIGFGYSAHPSVKEFSYTFDNLAKKLEALLFGTLGLKRFSIFVQDYGAPVGFRIASQHPDSVEGVVVQNGNAYIEGVSEAFAPFKPFWDNRTPETEAPIRSMLTAEMTKFQYTHGAKDASKISPDSYTFDQSFLNRPGNDLVQLNLFHDYQLNVMLYPKWQEYFRDKQPPTLITWGKNDPFFTVAGAEAFLRDLPRAELHLLNTGHFALEEESETIANHIRRFLGGPPTRRV